MRSVMRRITCYLIIIMALCLAACSKKNYSYDGENSCRGHLRTIGIALDLYRNENGGRYPDALQKVVPCYLKVIPSCPASGDDTYTSSYSIDSCHKIYTVYCKGNHHPQMGKDLPRNDSVYGLYPERWPVPWWKKIFRSQ